MATQKVDVYETQDKMENYTTSIRKGFDSLAKVMNANHNSNVYWQKKSLIITFIISAIIILSLVTSIILTNRYVKNVTENLNTIIELTHQRKVELARLEEKIDIMQADLDIITNLDENMNDELDHIEEVVDPIVYNTTEITQKSGFSAEQFNTIIDTAFVKMNKSNTALTGIGEGLYQAEQQYNVNGLYLLGIASLESGWGTSNYAKSYNNLYGLVGKKFDSLDECTLYMGKLIRENYIDKGYDTLAKIQSKYCPSGGSKWVSDIKWCANKYINAANELYLQQ